MMFRLIGKHPSAFARLAHRANSGQNVFVRKFSQFVQNFANKKYLEAYKAIVLSELKKIDLGETEAVQIIEETSDTLENQDTYEVHVLASQLALSTFNIVLQATGSKEAALQVTQNAIFTGQSVALIQFVNSRNK